MIFTFAFAASGIAKAVQSSPNMNLETSISLEIEPVVEAGAKCCDKEVADEDTQKPRCIADNLLASQYTVVSGPEIIIQHQCFLRVGDVYVLRKRFIRPPIA